MGWLLEIILRYELGAREEKRRKALRARRRAMARRDALWEMCMQARVESALPANTILLYPYAQEAPLQMAGRGR